MPGPDSDNPCVICLAPIAPAAQASLPSCTHVFHLGCIQDWSKIKNACPLCKREFACICPHEGGSIAVPPPVQAQEDDDESVDQACLVCGRRDREDQLLLCDGCEAAAHFDCAGLPRVPHGDWFCRDCRQEALRGTGRRAAAAASAAPRAALTAEEQRAHALAEQRAAEVDLAWRDLALASAPSRPSSKQDLQRFFASLDDAVAQDRLDGTCEHSAKLLPELVARLRDPHAARALLAGGLLFRFRDMLELDSRSLAERHLRSELLRQLGGALRPLLSMDLLRAARLGPALIGSMLRSSDTPLALRMCARLIETWARLAADGEPAAAAPLPRRPEPAPKRPRVRA
jgi:hypothetical protein